ncbi:hypothetical protein A3F02_00660 [Candidatus Curtissbacteria bacterium RIFCSPHIGHO2_12_FULL_38_9b]|uniref:Uncharacterized protein n=1 Tax=Candidatus Curtissbacteria bacterium RIFCSPHIGHO2_12_FULL_38_9b TaxID=1797720 RepID=A0A1F5GXA7_9BACT|nr:MAG: hypothetical protein A3F02_00660 [Candidatus Curtissbacteria bacterium RIFCSPHIGHO2_12_FULL_38_9b]
MIFKKAAGVQVFTDAWSVQLKSKTLRAFALVEMLGVFLGSLPDKIQQREQSSCGVYRWCMAQISCFAQRRPHGQRQRQR